jgi:hypothetical protein
MPELTYEEKKEIANKYLSAFDISWDDLPDINSLHDADDEEGIIELCDERLDEE